MSDYIKTRVYKFFGIPYMKNIKNNKEEKKYLFGLLVKRKKLKPSGVSELEKHVRVLFFNNTKLFDFTEPIDKNEYSGHFIIFSYRFDLSYSQTNLGDYVQSLATKNAILKIHNNPSFIYYDRDNLSYYNKQKALVIMQGWFSHTYTFLPNKNTLPVYVGMHVKAETKEVIYDFLKVNPSYFNNKSVGCRDISTMDFFKDIGVDSYFSRCLTLTLDKRTPNSLGYDKIFIVSIAKKYLKYIPKDILKNAEYIEQRTPDLPEGPNKTNALANMATDLINRYKKEAKLVITNAIHCAAPCVAMGIPVVLIDEEDNNKRFSALSGIIKVYTKEEMISGKINYYNTSVPDIESLKLDMIKNLEMSVNLELGRNVDLQELMRVRTRIANFNILKD
jgi:hypothetical protein